MKRLIPLLIVSSSTVLAADAPPGQPAAAQARAAAVPATPWVTVSESGQGQVAQGTIVNGRGFTLQPMVGGMGPMVPQSPAAQRYMRWQARGIVMKQYEDLGEALRLSPAETTKLIDVLADQMTNMRIEPRKALNDIASMQKQAQEIKARNDAEVAKVIGQNRMGQWEEYQKSLVFRSQVNMVREQLNQMGVPLTDDQRTQLLALFLQDREAPQYPQMDENLSLEERIAQSNKWQDENDRKMLERLRPVLTAEQLSRYGDYQAYMAEMRGMFQSYRASAQASGGVIQQQNGFGNSMMIQGTLTPARPAAENPASK